MSTLNERMFITTLEREGIDIKVNGGIVKGFFRINNSGEGKQFATLYTAIDKVNQGDLVLIDTIPLIAQKVITEESTVYQKSTLQKCNQLIEIMVKNPLDNTKATLTSFYGISDDISQSLKIDSDIITSQSSLHLQLPLTSQSKNILLNDRLYVGGNQMAWKVNDMIEQNGVIELHLTRSAIDTTYDDTTNGIADRWRYETKPSIYTTNITESTVTLNQDDTSQLTVSVLKDGVAMTETPTINWSVSDTTIASVDSTNTIKGLVVGCCEVSGSYKATDNDIAIGDTVSVTVNAKPVVADIVVTPAYNETSDYKLKQGYSAVTFTCSIDGVTSPVWNITLNNNGVASSYYESTIDNGLGTFTCKCVTRNANLIEYDISESTTGKTAKYYVKLASMVG
ncbi:Ig-like domain-containing protein [Aminicella lysinilytica]|uniref:Uncharacterized protein n=1 Tax=Aminicella lysinilytica TaxID=433323 RepID=A0A4R6Q7I7_9FIRM|nr:hypothetical protein [Aminicella lysinilytica]TDP58494.1 hypothetical protein EV211_1063 [Aminicella lysinilytica]